MKQYYQAQDIFNRIFENNTGTLRAGLNSTQDYLNAIYDPAKDAIRIKLEGTMLQAVQDKSSLPDNADEGAICPVVKSNGTIQFYRYINANWSPLSFSNIISGDTGGSNLTDEQYDALSWLVDNLSAMRDLASTEELADYSVKKEILILPYDNAQPIILNIQGEEQNIDDEGNLDGDQATHYRIDISGYVLDLETYQGNEAVTSDRYYTKVTYDRTAGISHIYLEKDEYNYLAGLDDGKNILKIFYLRNAFNGKPAVTSKSISLPSSLASPAFVDEQGRITMVNDTEQRNCYVITIPGYVLNIEGYYSEEDIQPSRFMTKMSYDAETNITSICFTAEAYSSISNLHSLKNNVDIFYLQNR